MKPKFSLVLAGFLLTLAALALPPALAIAQDTPAAAGEGEGAGKGGGKAAAKKETEVAEAARLITGPAGQPECLWVGRRIVSLIWRDDLDTAARHRELYERFGCPSGHIQDAFRCLVRQGEIDLKVPESLNERVHACWVNPDLQPPEPKAAAAAAGAEGAAAAQ